MKHGMINSFQNNLCRVICRVKLHGSAIMMSWDLFGQSDHCVLMANLDGNTKRARWTGLMSKSLLQCEI